MNKSKIDNNDVITKENDIFSNEKLEEMVREFEYMKKHREENEAYDDIDEFINSIISDD